MPRISPFTIVLTPEEQESLEVIARSYSSSYNLVVRAKIVLHASSDLSNKEIGQRLGIPRQVVSKWRKRFFEERLTGLKERARSGRPRGISSQSRENSDSL